MISGPGLLIRACPLLLYMLCGASGCSWTPWSACSMTCGKGRRTRTGKGLDCTQPLTQECKVASCYAEHLSSLAVTVTQHPKNRQRPSRNKRLMIDGMPTTVNGQSLQSSSCASTDQGDNPWVRLDLKKGYLVSVVRVIIFGSTGQNVAVRVGSSLTNNGSGNHQCGIVPYIKFENTKAIWRNVSCSPPVWGRYISFDRTVRNHFLEVCEVAFSYDAIVDIRIESSSVKGKSLSVYEGQGLQTPIDCIESTAYTVSLTWKFGDNVVQKLSNGQKPSIYQVNKNNMQRLHITATTASDNGKYSCHASIGSTTVLSKSFTLYIKVNCAWGAWSSTCNGNCGVGTQWRIAVIAVPEKHGGKPCGTSPVQFCDTQKKPCKPTISGRGASVVEGDKVVLSCHSLQYSDSSNHMTFEWFKVQSSSSLTPVITDSSRVVSTTSQSPNGRMTNFSSTLTFKSATPSDAGDYKCKASNQYGISEPSASANITVKYGPKSASISIYPVSIKPPVVIKGDSITLNCSAVAHPVAQYLWQGPNNLSHVGQFLTLSSVEFTNSGIYTCEAKNAINMASTSIHVRVEGPPPKCNQPLSTSSKASVIAINVNCPNGNSVIREFEVQYSETSQRRWRSVKFNASVPQPFLVNNLTAFTLYEVRIRAANIYGYEKGNASFSDPITVKTAEGGYIASEASSSESGLKPMAVVVIVVSLVLTTIIIVIVIVCQRRNQHLQTLLQSERNARDTIELTAATRNPAYGEVCLPGSEATCTSEDAPKNVENKLDEEDYEDVSSCNIEKDENIANAKGNQQEE